ncbi:type III-B CRISPR module RAMP protein Cmr6 [Hyperthermus butylicus]|uniref:DNA repair (RAMP superfamily) n=1 Tax=Hyperthermus butylicus (strain DSM 5456 / JCM 9403 / PLM1-5) TaxID=415426 RepID=A2BKQ7_HYPBU|nr:type III-B CRISPR module RAMP protein Cmr6 [Hyperthermus butylicus]ABM80568.1 DNA repair (RAMP superfamily) [Hyperthermus butylicus DSM 5456]
MVETAPCRNMMLCIAWKFSKLVLDTLSRGRGAEEFKGLKSKILEMTLNPHEIDVSSVCRSIASIGKVYYEPLVEGLERLGYCVVDVTAKTKSKLIVGASSGLLGTVLEVGLSWDYLLDLPYIPASSIKGLIRSWLVHTVLSNYKLSEQDKRRCIERILALTGIGREPFTRDEKSWAVEKLGSEVDPRNTVPSAGMVFVADAYPVGRGRGKTGCGLLDFDVVTPHYYRGGEPVRDEFEAQPNPVPYLVVAEGVPFRIVAAVGLVEADMLRDITSCIGLNGSVDPCGLLSFILLSSLAEGVGARTGKGYGIFDLESVEVHRVQRPTVQRRKPGRLVWKKRETPHKRSTT